MSRPRDPNSKAGQMRRCLLELIKEHRKKGTIPTNCRFLYYELVAKGLASKEHTKINKHGKEVAVRPDGPVIVALTELRKSGAIAWNEIKDETRDVSSYTGAPSIGEGLMTMLKYIRLDYWNGHAPLIITESRSLRGTLDHIADKYRCRITSLNGQCAGHLHNEVAPLLDPERPVLFLGDYDFSGGHIATNARDVLTEKVGYELDWTPLALTEDQVNNPEYNLTVIRKWDDRDKKFHDAVETEALGQEIIVGILEDALRLLVPETLEALQAEEEKQREALRIPLEKLLRRIAKTR